MKRALGAAIAQGLMKLPNNSRGLGFNRITRALASPLFLAAPRDTKVDNEDASRDEG